MCSEGVQRFGCNIYSWRNISSECELDTILSPFCCWIKGPLPCLPITLFVTYSEGNFSSNCYMAYHFKSILLLDKMSNHVFARCPQLWLKHIEKATF